MKKKKLFFGWTNIKYAITEFIYMYSGKASFFSKKRIESGFAFGIAEWGMIFFLLKKIDGMDTADLVMWATIQFGIAGYFVKQIQKEKVDETKTSSESSEGEIEQING